MVLLPGKALLAVPQTITLPNSADRNSLSEKSFQAFQSQIELDVNSRASYHDILTPKGSSMLVSWRLSIICTIDIWFEITA